MIRKYFLRDKNRAFAASVPFEILKGPYVTEKTAELAKSNVVVFKVALNANKIDIKKAFEAVFQAPVEAVNTINSKSRTKNFKGKAGKVQGFKKAMIFIKKDFDISKIIGVAQ